LQAPEFEASAIARPVTPSQCGQEADTLGSTNYDPSLFEFFERLKFLFNWSECRDLNSGPLTHASALQTAPHSTRRRFYHGLKQVLSPAPHPHTSAGAVAPSCARGDVGHARWRGKPESLHVRPRRRGPSTAPEQLEQQRPAMSSAGLATCLAFEKRDRPRSAHPAPPAIAARSARSRSLRTAIGGDG